ncbi:MAG: transposon-transfer assisting family protein [Defluviitaleaceae bacterium]|nr:transposon-transfer assisting family protein [Defluviitaleaceae bacterium]
MPILNFTAEETNFIAIYKADSLAVTLAKIEAAHWNILDEEIITIAESAARKLSALTETEFSEMHFALDEE